MDTTWLDGPRYYARHLVGSWLDRSRARRSVVVWIELARTREPGTGVDHLTLGPGALVVQWRWDELLFARVVGSGMGVGPLSEVTDYACDWSAPKAERLYELAKRWDGHTRRLACAHLGDGEVVCPTTGYRFGSLHLIEALPDEVVRELTGPLRVPLPPG